MPRPRKDTAGLSADELERLERDRKRKAEQKELERLVAAAREGGDQSETAIRAMWTANVKSLDATKREELDVRIAEHRHIHAYMSEPFRYGEDSIDLIIDYVEDFIKICPLSIGCGDGNTLNIWDVMWRYGGPRTEDFEELDIKKMPPYFQRYGLMIDYISRGDYHEFQRTVVRWYKRNKHRDASEFGWDADWPEIERVVKSYPCFRTTPCCDDYDSTAPRCTANPNCWRGSEPPTTSIPKGNSVGLTPKEVNLRRRLASDAFDFQRKVEKTITELDPSLVYSGLITSDDREN